MSTTGGFLYMDPESIASTKPWGKVDDGGNSYTKVERRHPVNDLRSVASPSDFSLDTSGFALHHSPAAEKDFTDGTAIRQGYYSEVEALLREKIKGVNKVVIFDHTIRKHDPTSPRQPVQQVHVDQTPKAAAARVRRHLPKDESEKLLKGRYQLINVWRPISHPATDFPLAFVDWRSTSLDDFIKVDLLYPDRGDDDDDRGKEALPDRSSSTSSTKGYSAKGETYGVIPNESHQFYYVKDMTPDEAVFIKCFDSRSEWMNDPKYGGDEEGNGKGVEGRASAVPHTAFIDPSTPEGTPGRQSIEVRALVFHEEGL